MSCLLAALFFLRFWRSTHDRLFVFLSLAFFALAAHWTALAIANPESDARHYVYLLRLLAFCSIIVGIVDKNRRGHLASRTSRDADRT